uniref:Granulin n=1 Tax=Astyanax mexicanus TaxID=7994 RepID=A0A8B9JPQ9_ASTMX
MRKSVWVLVCVLSGCSALICPDGGMCDDGNTCCQTPSGGYGCCPLPNVSVLKCAYCSLHFIISIMNSNEVIVHFIVLQAVVCPDQESECPDDTTCCQLPDGSWGCCPMPNAVCCEDKMHCCPQGTTCDLPHSKCVSSMLGSVPLRRKFPAYKRAEWKARKVDCPDKVSFCPDDTTCCPLGNGSYGCCPMPKAVCCSDHVHCCPQGTSCDLAHSKCVSSNVLEPVTTNLSPVVRVKVTVESVPCNDSVACESGSTCCKTKDGDWACCPLPEAVCCEDHIHCCPQGTVCARSTCVASADLLTLVRWVEKKPTINRVPQPANEKCDPTTTCPKGATCCKMESGTWGCCPLPQAVCCEDHLHCCPRNTVCNVAAGTCDSAFSGTAGQLSVPWVRKTPATSLPPANDQCDETSACPTGTTCCRQKSGAWACCPLPQAVCCDDHEHCCPQGYKCDIIHESCDHPFLPSMLWFKKQPALQSMTQQSNANAKAIAESAVADVESKHKCDAQTSCPRDNTCCYMKKFNKWGCCPLPEAVCCGDGDHCCPNSYTCDTTKNTCLKGHLEIPWFKKQEAKVTQGSEVAHGVADVQCDSTARCPTGSTCCRLTTGQWGCCPHVQVCAVCCDDHVHCCPAGYTCDLQAGTCLRTSTLHTVALTLVHTHTKEQVMCDATSHCTESQTCCKLSDTEWACCPFKQVI